jgi:hypothetical protein
MLRVSIESPFAGDVERNKKYAYFAFFDSLNKGESPFASHIFYTEILNDLDPAERRLGLDASHEWRKVAEKIVFYVDFGYSSGMIEAKKIADENGIPTEERTLNPELLASLQSVTKKTFETDIKFFQNTFLKDLEQENNGC